MGSSEQPYASYPRQRTSGPKLAPPLLPQPPAQPLVNYFLGTTHPYPQLRALWG